MTSTTQHASPSFWWDQLGGAGHPSDPLQHDTDTDVVIVGAGYTGLWTALELRRAAPNLAVTVIESAVAGYGASGRNGGWLTGLLDGPRDEWAKRCGPGSVQRLQQALNDTVDHVAAVVDQEHIDCDLHRGGALLIATTEPQAARLRTLRHHELDWGADPADWQVLDTAATRAAINVAGAVESLYYPYAARIQPAKLAVGLAHAVRRVGATLHEGTTVRSIHPHEVRTDRGVVRARWVVLATEGFTATLPGHRRRLLPMNSAMIVTEPLPDTVWADLGWDRCETFHDFAHRLCYLQRTADGRIAIGGRGRPYRYASRLDQHGALDPATISELRARLHALLPATRAARIDRGWCGVLGVSRDWSPTITVDHTTGLCRAGGYAGDGVAAASLAGRTLRDLILGNDTELTTLPWVSHHSRSWEPEPIRWLGVQAIYGLYRRADHTETTTGRPSRLAALASRLAGR